MGSHPIHPSEIQVKIAANQSHHILPVGSPKPDIFTSVNIETYFEGYSGNILSCAIQNAKCTTYWGILI